MNQGLRTVLIVVVALVLLAGSFYGGTLVGRLQAQASVPDALRDRMAQFAEGGGMGMDFQAMTMGEGFGRMGRGEGQGGLMGQIEQIDGNTLLITGFNDQQITVHITDTTLVEKYASVTAAELELGEQVIVSGSENDDGSYTARSVQVAQMGRFAPGAGGSQ